MVTIAKVPTSAVDSVPMGYVITAEAVRAVLTVPLVRAVINVADFAKAELAITAAAEASAAPTALLAKARTSAATSAAKASAVRWHHACSSIASRSLTPGGRDVSSSICNLGDNFELCIRR